MPDKSVEHHRFTNRLIGETSPYLLQHAHNPVDWYPWGAEALRKARDENKPIFLSTGYSACHWCHVMERESFEDEEIAALLNRHFVCIKVDREERPDIDDIYMTAVQLMRGNGGWPLNVFLTPDLKPFFGGTYFPPRDRHGLPGFKMVLQQLAAAWDARRDDLSQSAGELADAVRRIAGGRPSGEPCDLEPTLMVSAAAALREAFDATHGGFGAAPKFPSAAAIAFLLRTFYHTDDAALLGMASATLRHMAHGGIYDHLGGGFHRYSVDAEWLVPHFEKMLYDNAQLAQAYLEGFQATHDPLFERVARETLDYVLRDMTDRGGGFYSSEDADSEGEEGAFYLWKRNEILSVLGREEGEKFCAYYGVREEGIFTSPEPYHAGRNILHAARPSERTTRDLELARARLFEVRAHRVRPGRDDKVLASWNALMISALARGYEVLREDRYRRAAERAASFILDAMMRDGRLLRTYRNGQSRLPAYLDDYAFLVVALIDLYEATFDVHWLRTADGVARTMIDAFWDPEDGGFFFTGASHTDLIARTKPMYDGAVPSGNAVAVQGLLRLAELMELPDHHDRAQTILRLAQPMMARSPQGMLTMLCAADLWLYPPKEIAIAGAPDCAAVQGFLKALHGHFVPEKVVALVDPTSPDAQELTKTIPLLGSCALVSGKPAAYVCENFTCDLPATTPEALLICLGLPQD